MIKKCRVAVYLYSASSAFNRVNRENDVEFDKLLENSKKFRTKFDNVKQYQYRFNWSY